MTTDTPAQVTREQYTLDSEDGHCINLKHWRPAGEQVTGVLQVLHGLAEHSARYERFAHRLASHGFAVITHDHRGHGAVDNAQTSGHFSDDSGWQKVIDDVTRVYDWGCQQYPDSPRALFGHSMGSYIAQAWLMQNPRAVHALVLSGSTSAPRLQLYLGRFAARVEIWLRGRQHHSESLNKQAFGAFNQRFAPARTDFDWLSRDPDEVDKYVADPACGFLPTAGLWHDLLGGLITIGKKHNVADIPADLPILITGGSDDPVGGERGMQRLGSLYRQTAHANVTLKIYAGARHEMLNETNRDEFSDFVIGWLIAALNSNKLAPRTR